MLDKEVDEKYYISDRQLNGMATTNYASYKLSKLLKDDESTADTLKARFEGCPQLVSTGGTEIQRKVCNQALRDGLVKPNDVVEFTFSSARLKELENGKIKTQNSKDNNVMSTLKTHPQSLGVVVNDEEPFIVASRGRNPDNPSDRTKGCPTVQRLEPKFDGTSNTITSVQKDNYVATPYRIRKLTPKECWRLMGFGDDDFDKASKVCSSTQLYKQAGNSIVVNVLEAILTNLLKGEE